MIENVTRGTCRDVRHYKMLAAEKANRYLWLYEYAAVIIMAIIVTCTVPFGIKQILTSWVDRFGLNGASYIFMGICTASVAIICIIRIIAGKKYKYYYKMSEGFKEKLRDYLNKYWSQSIDGEDPNQGFSSFRTKIYSYNSSQ